MPQVFAQSRVKEKKYALKGHISVNRGCERVRARLVVVGLLCVSLCNRPLASLLLWEPISRSEPDHFLRLSVALPPPPMTVVATGNVSSAAHIYFQI